MRRDAGIYSATTTAATVAATAVATEASAALLNEIKHVKAAVQALSGDIIANSGVQSLIQQQHQQRQQDNSKRALGTMPLFSPTGTKLGVSKHSTACANEDDHALQQKPKAPGSEHRSRSGSFASPHDTSPRRISFSLFGDPSSNLSIQPSAESEGRAVDDRNATHDSSRRIPGRQMSPSADIVVPFPTAANDDVSVERESATNGIVARKDGLLETPDGCTRRESLFTTSRAGDVSARNDTRAERESLAEGAKNSTSSDDGCRDHDVVRTNGGIPAEEFLSANGEPEVIPALHRDYNSSTDHEQQYTAESVVGISNDDVAGSAPRSEHGTVEREEAKTGTTARAGNALETVTTSADGDDPRST